MKKKYWKRGLATTMLGVMIVGSLASADMAFAGKKLKVSQKTVTLQVGKSKTISTNMPVKFSVSNKKIVVLKKVKKKQCSIYGKKKGSCKVVVKAGKQKITVKVQVKAKVQSKKTPEPKKTTVPKSTKSPTAVPTSTPIVTVSPAAVASEAAVTSPSAAPVGETTNKPYEDVVETPTSVAEETASPEPVITKTPDVTEIPTVVPPVESALPSTRPVVEEPTKTPAYLPPTSTLSPTPTPLSDRNETATPAAIETEAPTATPDVTTQPTPDAWEEKSMVGGINGLGYQMLEQLKDDSNVVISPYSISSVLAMLTDGAEGNTKSEIEKVLGIGNYDAWQKEFCEFYKKNSNTDVEEFKFHADNSYWINDTKFSFDSEKQKNYMEKVKNGYNAETISMDFANTNPQDQINSWVDQKTDGVIKQIIPEKVDKERIAAILLNTIYFDAQWDREFCEGWKMNFHGTNGDTQVQNMDKKEEYYRYINENGLEMLELPFRDTNIIMDFVISEDLKKPATEIFSQLSEKEKEALFQKLSKQEEVLTNVILPKFKLEYGIKDVAKQLQNIGIQDAFDMSRADFPAIRGNNAAPFYVSSVFHKAVVDVKENGVTAAAATAGTMAAGCAPGGETKKVINFRVDRPFVFVLRDSESGMIYFIGQIENLSE